MKLLWLVLVMLICQVLASAQTPPPQAAGYSLVFSNDFSSLNINSSGNLNGNYTWFNPGMWWQNPAPWGNFSTTSGPGLNLNWTPGQSPANTSVSSCSPNGSNCQTWNHGYFEASMRFDVVTGAWPAFWMIPVEGHTLPSGSETGEWDIIEFNTPQMPLSGAYQASAHDWNGPGGSTQCTSGTYKSSSITSSNFNTYGMLWTAGTIQFYFNNNLVKTCNIDSKIDAQNYFLVLGSQEGVNWNYGNTSGVTASNISVNFDWVHVWQPGSGSQPPPAAPSAPTGLTATVS